MVADIPGLIEGAHEGKGLGIQFLRHIERTRILAILLDCSSAEMEADYKTLINELKSYSTDLLKKKRLLIYTKKDLVQGKIKSLKARLRGDAPAITISAVRGDGLEELIRLIWNILQQGDQAD